MCSAVGRQWCVRCAGEVCVVVVVCVCSGGRGEVWGGAGSEGGSGRQWRAGGGVCAVGGGVVCVCGGSVCRWWW